MEPLQPVGSKPICESSILDQDSACAASPADSFQIISPTCRFSSLVKEASPEQDQACNFYQSWVAMIPSPFLAHPHMKSTILQLLSKAFRMEVPHEEVVQVYQNASADHSVEDRLARVRTYLLFKEVHGINQRRSADPHFETFVGAVLEGLRAREVQIEEVEELSDELGRSLSGDYQEFTRLVRINLKKTCGFLEGWEDYVRLHEFYHWFDFRQRPADTRSKTTPEDREFEATKNAMKAFLVLKGGSFEGPARQTSCVSDSAKEPKIFATIDAVIDSLPLEWQPGYQLVWDRVRDFFLKWSPAGYIQKTYEASLYELREGRPHLELEEEARRLLAGRTHAGEILMDLERLLKEVKNGKLPSAHLASANQHENVLAHALYLATRNQIPLALNALDDLLRDHPSEGPPQTAPTLGSP